MRRIDVLLIGLGLLTIGGLIYWVLLALGTESAKAGLWSQVILVGGGGLVWVGSYLRRVLTGRMTLHQQLRDYEEAVIDQRLTELSPEELAKLQEQVAAERDQQTIR